jgi:hypothetical protein
MSIEQPAALGVPLTGVQLIEASAGTGKLNPVGDLPASRGGGSVEEPPKRLGC